MKLMLRAAVAALLGVVLAPPIGALPSRAGDEPLAASLEERFRTRSLRVLVLLQTVADFQDERSFPGHNGFSIAAARLGVAGELDHGFAYLVRANLIHTPSVLDAFLAWSPNATWTLEMGQFEVPFGKEFLTSAGTIDFVNRAQAVSLLTPGRQIGLQARVRTAEGRLGLSGGVWNGNPGAANGNDDEAFLYAARATVRPRADAGDAGLLELGVSGAAARDGDLDLLGGALPGFSGRRRLAGADARWTPGPRVVSAEVVAARLEPAAGGRIEPSGLHLTGGRTFTPRLQGLVRWERFRPASQDPGQDLVIAGLMSPPVRWSGCRATT